MAAGQSLQYRDDVSRETKLIDVASLPVDQVLDTNGAGIILRAVFYTRYRTVMRWRIVVN